MFSDLQKKTAQAIVSIFETSKVIGDYSLVVCAQGDAGGLTYGKNQTTINSGNLYLLIKAYIAESNAQFADELRPYLNRLKTKDPSLCTNTALRQILQQAGREDSVMIDVQDAFFDRVYWNPAVARAEAIGIETALGLAVVYDSTVHGSWGKMRNRTNDNLDVLAVVGERQWISRYIDIRRAWLESFLPNILGRTVYRMDAFRRIVAAGNWDLTLPFSVRGLLINEDTLTPSFGGTLTAERLLMLETPFIRGADVRELQEALNSKGANIDVDGIFGPATDAAVKAFQRQSGLVVDGIVGPATRAALGIGDDDA